MAATPAVARATELYQPTELAFTGASHPNPYTDVTMVVDFTGPDGQQVRVGAFWDGGTSWLARFAAPATGTWSYVTQASGDAALDAVTGTVEVEPGAAPGFLVPDEHHPRSFRRSRGEPVFLVGDTNWRAMSTVGGALPLATFQAYVDARAAQGFDFVRSYLVPIDAEGSSTNANEGGFAFEPWDPDHLNPAYFAAADERIEYAIARGLSPALLFGADERKLTDFFGWDEGKLERYVRYCVARYGAYDVLWEGRAEIEDQGTSPEPSALTLGNALGDWTMDADGHGHARSIHTTDSNREFGAEPWLDWLMHQGFPGSDNGYAWDWITADRAFGKPVMNEEFYYENSGAGATHAHHLDADTVRKGAWHVATSGAAGLAYGNTGTYNSRSQPFVGIEYVESDGADYLSHLAAFWRQTRFARLSPPSATTASDLVRAPGEEYVAYFETGGSRSIWIAPGTYTASWYDPRTGETDPGSETIDSAGQDVSFTAPDGEDWVLHVVRELPSPTDAARLGPVWRVGLGSDPDVAVASDGTVHIVYVRSGTVYYGRGRLDGVFEPEQAVGAGVDPRIALGPDGQPHVVLGSAYAGGSTVSYARWTSTGFATPMPVVDGGTNRKPRIEVDGHGNAIISFEDRSLEPTVDGRVRYVQVAPDDTVSEITVIGEDNNGGLAIDAGGIVHVTYRHEGDVRHVTSSGPGQIGPVETVLADTSDFSELALGPGDGSLHVVAEAAGGAGILYAAFRNGSWAPARPLGEAAVVGVDDPDHVNPAVAIDALGRVYVTFAGVERVPYYAVIDETDEPTNVSLLSPGGGGTGGKYENPNVAPLPGRGALAAWSETDHVYLRTIGVEPLEEPGTGGEGAAGGAGGTGGGGSGGGVGGGRGVLPGTDAPITDDGGCGCRTAHPRRTHGGLALVGLALLALSRAGARRRRERP